MSSSTVNLEEYFIPLEEISEPEEGEDLEIGAGILFRSYQGQLSERWDNVSVVMLSKSFDEDFDYPLESFPRGYDIRTEVEMLSILNHENIIPFIGYNDELDRTTTTIFKFACNKSLLGYLTDPEKNGRLTWAERLKICIGAAKGMEYLHTGLGEGRKVIHGRFSSRKVLLDHNLEVKVIPSTYSELVDRNQQLFHQQKIGGLYQNYIDPLFKEDLNLTTESDVYNFGLLMFRMLNGTLALDSTSSHIGEAVLIRSVRQYYDRPENLIDPVIRNQITNRSFHAFKDIAYKCISWNKKDRPTMNEVVKGIQGALDTQNYETALRITVPALQEKKLESNAIPLKEIILATQNFSSQSLIGAGDRFSKVYKGILSENWQHQTVAVKRFSQNTYKEIFLFTTEYPSAAYISHANIVGLVGHCKESDELILVHDYISNGSVDQHLREPNKRRCLTWAQRLKICLGAAAGLEYLHSCFGEEFTAIHKNINSKNILLDDNFEAKLNDFSFLTILDKPQVYDKTPVRASYYTDPIYEETGLVNTKLDVYSFGLVLLELLSGMQAHDRKSIGDDHPQTLIHLVRHHNDDELDILIDPLIPDQVNILSFRMLIKTVNRCICLNLEDRPTMKQVRKMLEKARDVQNQEAASTVTTPSSQHRDIKNFRISLDEINLAIKDFSIETPIGGGGYGKVYKAQLSERWENCIVAIKCLDPKGYQGKTEFSNEVTLLSRFHHQHIIPFVGYCDEGDQMIIVSKYAVNGSLDDHLRDKKKKSRLTWLQRLTICLGAAKGLEYLHSGRRGKVNVIHRDVKSANILLDENLEAKICDFGLSKEGLKNQKDTYIHTKVAGTNFYLDPLYRESSNLRKESDVYSFGVVLFEMLTGMLAYGREPLISLVRHYQYSQLEILIDADIKDQINNSSFHTFQEVAFRCISLNIGERPTMVHIIDEIEDAMEFQARTFL